MEVFQCPDCELRFRFPSELDDHMLREHPDFRCDPKSIEDALLGATHRHRHLTPKYVGRYDVQPSEQSRRPLSG